MFRVPDRIELLKRLPLGSVGVELGVLEGAFAADILREVQPATLHLVDRWELSLPQMVATADGWMPAVVGGSAALLKVQQRFAWELQQGQVKLHQADSLAWLTALPDTSLDWAYLDSAHAGDHVFQELCLAAAKVKPGGWILGHDYCAVCPGVVYAVDRFCREQDRAIGVLTDEPWNIPVNPRLPWMPPLAAFHSYAIQNGR